jgi:CTP:molybdopterin cytidylyltransferase MocA
VSVAGLLLAAGAGRRFGGPKALAGDGLWLRRAVAVLVEGGCFPVRVVLGARAEDAARLLPDPELAVVATDWQQGMSASLRAGLRAVGGLRPEPDAVLVHLVDLPDVTAGVVARLVAVADGPDVLARAVYGGRPGHPVLIGKSHWREVAASVSGDAGARAWLNGRDDMVKVECSDLAVGADVDHPPKP